MKKIIQILPLFIFSFVFTACDVHDPYYYHDNVPPSAPRNVYVINGDNRVDIVWTHNRENDVAGYNVYYSYSYNGKYTLIGSTSKDYFIDYDAANGVRYYYGIAAYDYNGNESELSPDVAYATPRPEGYDQIIYDYLRYPEEAGYSFTTYTTVPYDDLDADFFYEFYDGSFFLNVWDDTYIIDMGPTRDILDIEFAPVTGWSPFKYVPVVPGHTYVIWTWDDHYAKVRVSSVSRDRMIFDWAFQLVEGERQLKPGKSNDTRVMESTRVTKRLNELKESK